MNFDFKRITTLLIFTYFILFVFLCFINLAYLPVATYDETYLLDPAIQFFKTGHFSSRIWQIEGAEIFCFAYMPMVSILHIANLYFMPWEIFYERLPFLVLSLIGFYFYFRFLKESLKLNILVALLALFFFINDKSVSEALRSIRPESIEIFLLPIVFWRVYENKNSFITVLFLSILTLTHPKCWAIVFVLGLFLFFQEKSWFHRFIIFIVFISPIIAFFAWGKFDFELLKMQLGSHASEHDTSSAKSDNIFVNHFFSRFFPFYNFQPYVFLIFICSIFIVLRSFHRNKQIKSNLIEICFLATNVYWFFTLGGFPRYDSTLMLMSYLLFFKHFESSIVRLFHRKRFYGALLVLAPIVCFPFISRHSAALLQRNAREINGILSWYDSLFANKSGKNVLLLEDCSAHYYAINHEGFDFGFLYTKHKFEDYNEVFVCTHDLLTHPEIKKIDEYKVETINLTKESGSKAITYNEIIVYQVLSKKAYEYLKTDQPLNKK